MDSPTFSCTVPGLAAGDYKVTVFYSGDPNYEDSQNNDDFTIDKVSPEIDASTVNIDYTEDETITVTIKPVDGGATPTGNVTVTITDSEGNVVKTITEEPITDGAVKLNVPGLDADDYNVTIVYNGDNNYTAATKNSTFTVNKVHVVITVVTDVIGYIGDTIKVTIKVEGVDGQEVNGGTVTYVIDYSTRTPLSADDEGNVANSQAVVDVNLDGTSGKYLADVQYSGDKNYYSANADDEAIILALNTTTSSNDVSGKTGDKKDITADITDHKGKPVQNGTAVLTVDGKEYTANVTDGKVTFEGVELTKNTTATIKYLGNDYYNSSNTTIDLTVNEETEPETEPEADDEPDDNSDDGKDDDSDEGSDEGTDDVSDDESKETNGSSSKIVSAEKGLATGNPIAMLLIVLMALVSTISIRRQK